MSDEFQEAYRINNIYKEEQENCEDWLVDYR